MVWLLVVLLMKINKHIEIVRSTDSWLSSMSQLSCDNIFEVLTNTYSHVGVSVVNNLNDLKKLVEIKPDLVFLGMKFIPADNTIYSQHSDKIWLADYLDESGIAYTGSNKLAHELEVEKSLAKGRVLDAGLSTSPYSVIGQYQKLINYVLPSDLMFPVFIKPSNRGGGLGIDSKSIANNQAQLKSKVKSISKILGSDSLVEKYLVGREFSVAILKYGIVPSLIAMPIELVTEPDSSGSLVLSSEVKSANLEKVSAIADPILKSLISKFALDIFSAIGGRDYGRIDIRLNELGVPQFLEANLMPSLIDNYGSFPKACRLNIGLGYKKMVLTIVSLGLVRSNKPIDPGVTKGISNILAPKYLVHGLV